ncbi:MAG: cyclic nucleotide-binding domain-containing protein [Anaerolineales bacterium]|nr:cyclic nucleotide-binding domain-containing protein [Anaerolineales bacterium]
MDYHSVMLETLNYIRLFQDLKPDQVVQLDPLFERLNFTVNETLFAQGEPAKYLYILLKGNAVITYKPYDGPAITLTRLQPGDVFGWSAVVGSAQYTSGSISVSHVEVARVLASDLWQFVRDHPETGEFLLNRIASSVSTRWKDAHVQVQAMLDKGRST